MASQTDPVSKTAPEGGRALLPCPFCGCTDISEDDNGYEGWLKCDWCGATSGYDSDPQFEAQPLAFHWNRRSPYNAAGGIFGPYGYLIKPIGLAEDEWSLSDDPSDRPDEAVSVPLYALEAQMLGEQPVPAPEQGEVERLTALVDRLRQEAQIHAMEARGANATIYEIYQAVTGATGEPGNWHGAKPVIEALAAERTRSETMREAVRALLTNPDKASRAQARAALAQEKSTCA